MADDARGRISSCRGRHLNTFSLHVLGVASLTKATQSQGNKSVCWSLMEIKRGALLVDMADVE